MMKAVVAAACALASSVALGLPQPAFPGAEGFGGNVIGGRGGKVIWVTNLNSRGPGSLRAACDTPGPRIIKFKVAGTIEQWRDVISIGHPFRRTWKKLLKAGQKEEQMKNPYSFVTIDGSSAPAPGITISGNMRVGPFGVKQVIIRNLRIRDNGFVARSGSDCLTITGSHVLVDHCSFQWARDEVVNCWYPSAHDITVQWCIIGPGWERHAFGWLNGGGSYRVTLHHCLLAHNRVRNPRMVGLNRKHWLGKGWVENPLVDCRNNIIYNCRSAAVIDCGPHVNMVGNRFLPGPDAPLNGMVIRVWNRHHTTPSVAYLKGNISPKRPTNDLDEWAAAGHLLPRKSGKGWRAVFGPYEWGRRRDTPFPTPPVVTHSAEEARDLVLGQVGAWPRDPVDAGILRTVLHGSGYVGARNTLPSDFTNARPSARAAASANGLVVAFRGEATDTDGKIVSYTWEFGDGRRAVGRNVTHTYGRVGSYVAMLFVVDDQGMSATASLNIVLGKGGFKAEPVRSLPRPLNVRPAPTAAERWKPPTVKLRFPLTAPPTEKDWANAQRLAPFINQASRRKAPDGQFDARVLHDAKHLYLRVTAAGIKPAWLKESKLIGRFASPARDSREYYGKVNVTAFISPKHGKAPWYRFLARHDGGCRDSKGPDRRWNPTPDWRIMSKRIGEKWQLTAAISLRAMEAAPKRGQAMGLKLTANLDKDIIFIWPPVGSAGKNRYCAPHSADPVYYAKLRFP